MRKKSDSTISEEVVKIAFFAQPGEVSGTNPSESKKTTISFLPATFHQVDDTHNRTQFLFYH